MHHRLFRLGIVCATAVIIASGPAPAQVSDDYKPLEAKYLRGPLAPYWATGVAFVDTVVKPGGTETLKHGRKRYLRIETKAVGTCYIDADLGPRLKELQAGRSYVFTGTVLQKEKGFFSFGEPEYFIAIMGLQSAMAEAADIPDQVARFNLPTNSADALMLSNLGVLLRDLQTEIAIMARARGVEPWELLDAANTNRPAAELMISSSLSSYSSTIKVAEEDILGQLLLSLIAARVQPAAPSMPLAASNAPPKAAVKTPAAEQQPEADDPAPAAGIPLRATDDAAARKAAEKQAAEQAAQAKKVEAEKKRQEKLAAEKAEADRLAAEKKAREEKEKMAELQAAQAKQAQAEKQRLERERVAAEKKAAEEKARLAREQESREREARAAAEKKAQEEAEAARKAAAPKLRVTPRTDADAPVPATPEPKAVQPAAKLQPTPPAPPAEPKPAPTPKPAAAGDDPDAPVPF